MYIQQYLRRPVCKHAASLGLSDPSLQRILHTELVMYPYKIIQFYGRDWENHRVRLWKFNIMFPVWRLIRTIVQSRQKTILINRLNDPCIALRGYNTALSRLLLSHNVHLHLYAIGKIGKML